MPKTKVFKELKKAVEKTYLGKEVPKQYRSKYGKKYDKDEMESLSYAIAKSKHIKVDKRR